MCVEVRRHLVVSLQLPPCLTQGLVFCYYISQISWTMSPQVPCPCLPPRHGSAITDTYNLIWLCMHSEDQTWVLALAWQVLYPLGSIFSLLLQ